MNNGVLKIELIKMVGKRPETMNVCNCIDSEVYTKYGTEGTDMIVQFITPLINQMDKLIVELELNWKFHIVSDIDNALKYGYDISTSKYVSVEIPESKWDVVDGIPREIEVLHNVAYLDFVRICKHNKTVVILADQVNSLLHTNSAKLCGNYFKYRLEYMIYSAKQEELTHALDELTHDVTKARLELTNAEILRGKKLKEYNNLTEYIACRF